MVQAIETTGTLDASGELRLDEPMAAGEPRRVRVNVLLLDEQPGDITEREWLTAAARNPAFNFLNETGEDIYTPTDGRPFRDPG